MSSQFVFSSGHRNRWSANIRRIPIGMALAVLSGWLGVSSFANAGTILQCPPAAAIATTVSVIEGQIAPMGVEQVDPAAIGPPPAVNVRYRVQNPSPQVSLFGTGVTDFTYTNFGWVPSSPMGFEFRHFNELHTSMGAAAGSPYTVGVSLVDPNGCGPSPTETVFTVNVTPSSTPDLTVQSGGTQPPVGPGQPFMQNIVLQVTNNGTPLQDVVVHGMVQSGDVTLRPLGVGSFGSTGYFFSDPAGNVTFEVQAGATPGPVEIRFNAPEFTPVNRSVNLLVAAGAPTLTCPPPAVLTPPMTGWVEGQIADFAIGQTLATMTAPPNVNAAWRIDGNPTNVEFVQSLSNMFDEVAPWTEISPGQYQYGSGTGVKFKAGSSGGSSQSYTIRAYANDPGGCGTFVQDQTFNITVDAPTTPVISQTNSPATTANPTERFTGVWAIEATNNGTPLPNTLVRFNVVTGDGGFGPPGAPVADGRPPPVTEIFVTTNPLGVAEVAVFAGATPGPLLVRATSPDFAPGQMIDLNLTINGGTVDSFVGTPTPNTFGAPIETIVTTSFGPFSVLAQRDMGAGPNPLAGVPVRFIISGDAILLANGVPSGTTADVITNASGNSEVEVIAGSTAGGVYTLTAQVASGPFAATPVTWFLSNLPEPNHGTITVTSGNNQTIEPGQAFEDLEIDIDVLSLRAPDGQLTVDLVVLSGDASFPPARGPGLGGSNLYRLTVPFTVGRTSHTVPVIAGTGEGPIVIRADGIGFMPTTINLAIQSSTPPPPTNLEVISGSQQSAIAGENFASPLVVAIPAGFVPTGPTDVMTFSVLSGDVFLLESNEPVRSLTTAPDNAGRASIPVRAGVATGNAVVQVEFPGLTPAQFPLTVVPNPSAIIIEKTGGDRQSALINTRLPQALAVSTTGAGTLAWRVVRGVANIVGSTNGVLTTTLANGQAQAQVVLGNTVGPVEIEVAGQGFQAVRFTATALAPATNYRLEKITGDLQTLRLNQPSQPLRIRVTDGGVPLTNFNVVWTFQGSGTIQTNQTSTNAGGFSDNTFTPLNSGLAFVRATVTNPNGGGQASVDFTLDTPFAALRLLTAAAQSGAVGTLADEDFVFQLSQNDIPLSGELVQFSLVGPGSLSVPSATTDGTGKVFVRLRYGASAGPVIVTASALGGAATASATATAFVPGITIASGNNQSGRPGETLPQPLVVEISQPIAPSGNSKSLGGVSVIWSVTCGGGSLASASTTTDNQGKSSNQFTLGPQPGCNNVKANIVGVGEITFTATGLVPATGIEIVSGDGQSLAPGEASAPLVVRVVNSAGQPVNNVRIVFEPTSTGATVDPAEVLTNDQGRAQTIARVGLPIQVQIRAKAADFPGIEPKLFTLTASLRNTDNLPPAVRGVAAVIDGSCVALSQLPNPNPAQLDLLQRCSELVANAASAPGEVGGALGELQTGGGESQNQVALAVAGNQAGNLQNRMTALRNGSASNGFQNNLSLVTSGGALQMGYLPSNILGLNAAETPEAGAQFSRWGFFASGTIGRGKRDAFEEDPGFDFRTYGVTAGVDYRLNDSFVLGAALGFNRNDSDIRGNQGGTDTKGTSLSGYVSWYHPRSFYIDGVVTIGQSQFDIEREISYTINRAGGGRTVINQTASASPDGDQTSLSVSFGKDWNRGAWAIGPYGRLNWTRIDFDGYTETMSNPNGPGAGLALSVDGREIKSLQGVFGGKVSYTTSTSWGVLVPYAQLEWVSEFEDDPGQVVSRFAFDPTRTAIIVESDAIDSDYLNFGLGLSGVFANGKSAFLYYERIIGQDRMSSDSLAAGLRIEF